MAKDRLFYIDYGDELTVNVDEVWPDGDAPEDPTAQDVIEKIKAQSSRHSFAMDWGLYPNATVDGKEVW